MRVEMSLRNPRQECLKGNESYSLFGLPELKDFPHALLPCYLWFDICILFNLLLSLGYWVF